MKIHSRRAYQPISRCDKLLSFFLTQHLAKWSETWECLRNLLKCDILKRNSILKAFYDVIMRGWGAEQKRHMEHSIFGNKTKSFTYWKCLVDRKKRKLFLRFSFSEYDENKVANGEKEIKWAYETYFNIKPFGFRYCHAVWDQPASDRNHIITTRSNIDSLIEVLLFSSMTLKYLYIFLRSSESNWIGWNICLLLWSSVLWIYFCLYFGDEDISNIIINDNKIGMEWQRMANENCEIIKICWWNSHEIS